MKNSLFVVDIIDYHAALCPPVTDSQTVYDIGDLGNFGAGEMQAPFEAAVLKLQVWASFLDLWSLSLYGTVISLLSRPLMLESWREGFNSGRKSDQGKSMIGLITSTILDFFFRVWMNRLVRSAELCTPTQAPTSSSELLRTNNEEQRGQCNV
jgi:hypothetical protein